MRLADGRAGQRLDLAVGDVLAGGTTWNAVGRVPAPDPGNAGIDGDHVHDVADRRDASLLKQHAAIAPLPQQRHRVRREHHDAADNHSSTSRISGGMQVDTATPSRIIMPSE